MKRRRLAKSLAALADAHATPVTVFSWNVSWETTKPCTEGFGTLGAEARADVARVRRLILETVLASNADIVALQETPKEWREELVAALDDTGYETHFLSSPRFGLEGMATAWKRDKFSASSIKEDSFEGIKGRPITTIDFGGFTFVNLHAGHDYTLERFREKLRDLAHRSAVVVAGDFNRPVRRLDFGRATVRLHNCSLEDLLTCCALEPEQSHALNVDHILSDLGVRTPTFVAARVFPASDHLPIQATLVVPRRDSAKLDRSAAIPG